MPKTSTSTLQQTVFPLFCEARGLSFNPYPIEVRDFAIKNSFYIEQDLRELNGQLKPLDFLISRESLVGWDPHVWEHCANQNLALFGEDAEILISIRKPSDFLTSIYQQWIHSGYVIQPELFFLKDDVYSPYLDGAKFRVELFSIKYLLDLYSQRFKRIHVIPFKDVSRMDFLNVLDTTSEDELNKYRDLFHQTRHNRAYSRRAMKLTLTREHILRFLSLSSDAELSRLRPGLDAADTELNGTGTPVRQYLRNGSMRRLSWRYLMQGVLDKTLPYRKWKLDFHALGIEIEALDNEYDGIVANLPNHTPMGELDDVLDG